MSLICSAAPRVRLAHCAQLIVAISALFVAGCGGGGGGGGDQAASIPGDNTSSGQPAAGPAPAPDADGPVADEDQPPAEDSPAGDTPGGDTPPPADEPGEDAGEEAPDSPPIAEAGLDTGVSERTIVALDAHASRNGEGALSYRWQQTGGSIVAIDDPLAPRTQFVAPSVSAPEVLSFELTVTDAIGNVAVDTIDITVVDEQAVPGDQNEFLTWLDDLSAFYVGSEDSAAAYYAAVDPLEQKTNLADWLSFNGFSGGPDSRAAYRNAADLGFGRVMSLRTLADGGVAAYVENYPTLDDAVTAVDTGVRDLLLATVAMEYSPGPQGGEPFTKFYVFGPDDERITSIDLDGRGAKFVPGLCNVCHGGQPQPLLGDVYPESGNTDAQFLPWDPETYEFSANAGYTREDQADAIKALNAGALSTYPDAQSGELVEGHWSGAAARELIEGWYGGPGLPGDFDAQFVPDGWRAEINGGPAGNPSGIEALYLNVVAPNCRACHVMRGRYFSEHEEGELIDFSSFAKFIAYEDVLTELLYESGEMPDALVTYDQFWTNHDGVIGAEVLARYLGIDATDRRPGRPLADAGPNIRVALGTVRLNGSASAFADSFEWTFAPGGRPSGSNAEILGANTATPTIETDMPGVYRLQLIVSNEFGQSAPAFVALTAVFGTDPVRFSPDIAPIIAASCASCHSEGRAQSVAGIPVRFDEPLGLYERLTSYIDVEDYAASLLLSKPEGVRHGGRTVPGFDLSGASGSDRGDYDRVLQWISEGASGD